MSLADSAPDLPAIGDVLAGKYVVESILGAGGMGVVVAATHLVLKQRVAVKLLLPHAAKLPNAAERFLREAKAAAAIQSLHVARVLDVGTLESGAPYLVMEYLFGSDLAQMLKADGPFAPAEAADYVLQASSAIAEAHALGIVHRDLKPSNLFLAQGSKGEAVIKVLDFGLSKMPSDGAVQEGSLTAAGVVAGSPHYMSPEQVRSLKHVDSRTDIWSLGVILHELVTGSRPFHGPSVTAICASVAADAPASLRELRPDIPDAFAAIVLRCLEKDPSRRLQRVEELADALRGIDFRVDPPRLPVSSQAAIVPPPAIAPAPQPSPAPFVIASPAPLAPPAPTEISALISSQTSPPVTLGSARPPQKTRVVVFALAAASMIAFVVVAAIAFRTLFPKSDAPAGAAPAESAASTAQASGSASSNSAPPNSTPPNSVPSNTMSANSVSSNTMSASAAPSGAEASPAPTSAPSTSAQAPEKPAPTASSRAPKPPTTGTKQKQNPLDRPD